VDIRITTYKDLLDHAVDYLGANPGGDATRDSRRAVQAAYRDVANRHRWIYYYTRGRLNTVAPYYTGTVTYTATTRTLTLTGGVWPTWAQDGIVQINNIAYQIASRVDDNNLLMARRSDPGADIGTSGYTIYRDTYELPADCLAIDRMILINNAFEMWYEHPAAWLERQRIYHSPAIPRVYTIRGSPNYAGSFCVSFFPPPDNVYQYDYIYQRRPRPLIFDEVSQGVATITQGSATVTGNAGIWTNRLVGSSLRLSGDAILPPTGLVGVNPSQLERVIMDVPSSTTLTLDQVSDVSLANVKYLISDPCDIEEAAMLTALQRGIEMQVSLSRNMKTAAAADKSYRIALIEAMEADNRSFAAEKEGPARTFPYRLAQMPRGPDIS
jgi:hypothetical protein